MTHHYGIIAMAGPVLLWVGFTAFSGMFAMVLIATGSVLRQVLWSGVLCSISAALYGASVFWNEVHHGFTPEYQMFRLLAGLTIVVAASIVAPQIHDLIAAICILSKMKKETKERDAEFEESSQQTRMYVKEIVHGGIDPNTERYFAQSRK